MKAIITLLFFAVTAHAQEKQCAARLIRSKPSALQVVKSETIKACVPGETAASIEDAAIRTGKFSNRLQGTVTIRNRSSKAIRRIEWRLDVYDEQRKRLHDTLYLSEDKAIKARESGNAAQAFNTGNPREFLPKYTVILVQISKVVYKDGSTYQPPVECKANESFDDALCSKRNP